MPVSFPSPDVTTDAHPESHAILAAIPGVGMAAPLSANANVVVVKLLLGAGEDPAGITGVVLLEGDDNRTAGKGGDVDGSGNEVEVCVTRVRDNLRKDDLGADAHCEPRTADGPVVLAYIEGQGCRVSGNCDGLRDCRVRNDVSCGGI